MLTPARHRYLTRWNRRAVFALVVLLLAWLAWRDWRIWQRDHPVPVVQGQLV